MNSKRNPKTKDIRRLLSLVLCVVMALSLAAPAFAQTVSGKTYTYYFLTPETVDVPTTPHCYWWTPTEAVSWPGTEMEYAPEIGKRVYKIEVPIETSVIIFNGQFGQTNLLYLSEADTGYDSVDGMIYVITGWDESGQVFGSWYSTDPYDSNYYRNSSGYDVRSDHEQMFIPSHRVESSDSASRTLYFLAPDFFLEDGSAPYAITSSSSISPWPGDWNVGNRPSSWPGKEMTPAPEVGKNVYKINVPDSANYIVFHDGIGGTYPTESINLSQWQVCGALQSVPDGSIFMLDYQDMNMWMGAWYSIDPDSLYYYKKMPQYKVENNKEPVGDDEVCTYYFYAPKDYTDNGTPYAYWWTPSEVAPWPGIKMESAPEIGDNVFKVTAPKKTKYIIFNDRNGRQTVNISIYISADYDPYGGETFGVYDGKIYMFVGKEYYTEHDVGSWFSVNPYDYNYYRRSEHYNDQGYGYDTPDAPEETPDEPYDPTDSTPYVEVSWSDGSVSYNSMWVNYDGNFEAGYATYETGEYTVRVIQNGKTIYENTFYPMEVVDSLIIICAPTYEYYKKKAGVFIDYVYVEGNGEELDFFNPECNIDKSYIGYLWSEYDESDNYYAGDLYYYFLAPEKYLQNGQPPRVYWWDGDGSDDWPGNEMEEYFGFGKNVYRCSVPRDVSTIIFNDGNNGGYYQTINIDVTSGSTCRRNVGNMIYVITGNDYYGYDSGEWYSLNPDGRDYYKNSPYYTYDESDYPRLIVYNRDNVIAGEKAPEEYGYDTEDEAYGTIFFRADGDLFDKDSGKLFYIWDETTGMYASKNGWTDYATWGSNKLISGTKVEGTDDLFESYPFEIPDGHNVYLVVYDRNTGRQTCDLFIDKSAFGDVVYLTGDMLENPVDASQYTVEARFENTNSCGPIMVLTSTCNTVGVVHPVGRDDAYYFAYRLLQYVAEEGNEYYTHDKVAKALGAFGLTAEEVWSCFRSHFGIYREVYYVLFGSFEVVEKPYIEVEYDDYYYMALMTTESGETPLFYVDFPMYDIGNFYDVRYWYGDDNGNWRWVDYGTLNTPGIYRLYYDYFTDNYWYELISVEYSGYADEEMYLRYIYVDRNGRDKIGRCYMYFEIDDNNVPGMHGRVVMPEMYTEYDLIISSPDGKSYDSIWIGGETVVDFYYNLLDHYLWWRTSYEYSDTPDEPYYPDYPETADYPDYPETEDYPDYPDYAETADEPEPDYPDPVETSDTPWSEDTPDVPAPEDHTGDVDESGRLLGDLTNDGCIDSADSLIALRISVDLEYCSDEVRKYADVDGDGMVTGIDALSILRYSVRKGHLGNVGQPA